MDNDDDKKNTIAIIIPVPVTNADSHDLHESTKQALQKLKDSMRTYDVHRQKQITEKEEMSVIEQNTRDVLTKKILQNKIRNVTQNINKHKFQTLIVLFSRKNDNSTLFSVFQNNERQINNDTIYINTTIAHYINNKMNKYVHGCNNSCETVFTDSEFYDLYDIQRYLNLDANVYFVPILVSNDKFIETLLAENILSVLNDFEHVKIIALNEQPCPAIVHTVFSFIANNNDSEEIKSNENLSSSSYVFFIINSIRIRILEKTETTETESEHMETKENDDTTATETEEVESTILPMDSTLTTLTTEKSTTTPLLSTKPTDKSSSSSSSSKHSSQKKSPPEPEYEIISPPNESPQYSKDSPISFDENRKFSPTVSPDRLSFGMNNYSALLEIARAVLNQSMSQIKWIQDKRVHKGGVFVTLKKGTRLRGCVGHTVSQQDIVNEVIDLTKAAYKNDSRFDNTDVPPSSLRISISILSPLQRIQSLKHFKEGVHGLVIKDRTTQQEAVYLPEVFIENGFKSKTEYLKSLCKKARIDRNKCDEHRLKMYVFTSQIFDEN